MLDYFDPLIEQAQRRKGILFQEYSLQYPSGTFPYFRFCSAEISAQDKILLLASGIHGNERCGPYTLQKHFSEIFESAHEKGVRVVMYPLRNPSGYTLNQRFNCEKDMGDSGIGNNDCLRYQLSDHSWVDDLRGREYRQWRWADDPRFNLTLTAEDSLFLRLLHQEPWEQIKATLDLHQDHLTEYLKPGAYHYSPSRDTDPYLHILENIAQIVPILTNTPIDGGHVEVPGFEEDLFYTDERGFISRHDGSFDDLAYLMGVPHAISNETSGEIPLEKADQVNMVWIKGMIDMISKE
jgi:hypothetical protein